MNGKFIVTEITKNWVNGQPATPGTICLPFERVINVNDSRGYRLHSFTLHQINISPTDLMETIVAVFEAKRKDDE